MTREQFKRLEAEWNARLRADGFQDIEAPSGVIERRETKAASPAKLRRLAQLEQDREATPRLRFGEPWERKAWELHCDGVSNREIARKMCLYRKLVNQAFWRLRDQVLRPRRGPKRDESSMRHDGVNLTVRLTRDAALALDHVRQVLNVGDLVRGHLIEVARKIPIRSAG
jgi:hypothetical protein